MQKEFNAMNLGKMQTRGRGRRSGWSKVQSMLELDIPGPQDKRLSGNGEKLTYSCPAGCN